MIDTIAPVVSFLRNDQAVQTEGKPYTDTGAETRDNYYEAGELILTTLYNLVKPNTSGTYLVGYQAEDPSGNRSAIAEREVVIEAIVGMEEVFDKMRLEVYPNPTSGPLRVALKMPQTREVALSVTDVTGRTLLNIAEARQTQDANFTVDASQLAEGVHLLRVAIDGQQLLRRFKVQR